MCSIWLCVCKMGHRCQGLNMISGVSVCECCVGLNFVDVKRIWVEGVLVDVLNRSFSLYDVLRVSKIKFVLFL